MVLKSISEISCSTTRFSLNVYASKKNHFLGRSFLGFGFFIFFKEAEVLALFHVEALFSFNPAAVTSNL